MYFVATKFGFVMSTTPKFSMNGQNRFPCSPDIRVAQPFSSRREAESFAIRKENYGSYYFAVVQA